MRRLRRTDDAGFTMIELLVAMILTSVLGALLLGSALGAKKVTDDAQSNSELTADVRRAMERLVRELRQAEAAVGRDKAMIAQAEATLARDSAQAKFAETDAARYAELSKAGVVSKSQYDQSRTSADVSREAARATQASIDQARKTTTAPVLDPWTGYSVMMAWVAVPRLAMPQ